MAVLLVLFLRNLYSTWSHIGFSLMFSLRSFIVLSLTFRLMIHLELIFCIWSEWWVGVHFFAYGCPTIPAPFVEDYPFSAECAPLSKITWPHMCESISLLFFIHSFLTWVQALVREDPTCCGATKPVCHNYWACALEPASHNYWSPCATTTEACAPRACAPQ